ncbi:Dihydroflavonol-4-reductase [Dactylellina cionopaga]|nr:Dihydroflavonol-4-reductase [Dactylellina cionopaga]
MTKVLLTGGSGFIAAHILELLVQRGYEIVTTVRSEDKASKIREANPHAKLSVVIVPDIAQPDAFDEVVKTPGLDVVLHTASPFHFNWLDAKTELLEPAITGTTSILKAIKKSAPGVKRVIVTSSFVSMLSVEGLQDPNKVFSESDWNPNTYEDGLTGNKVAAYRVSKTVAEQSAWKFVAEEKPNFDLVTICPPLVFGPTVHHLSSLSAINTSNERFVDLVRGKWKNEILPSIGVNLWVDVRDVALAHVAAFEKPDAGGKRFFCTAGKFCNREIAAAARKNFPGLKDKLPSEEVMGGEYPPVVPGYDNSRATGVLGIDWIDLEKSTVDNIKSLLTIGA